MANQWIPYRRTLSAVVLCSALLSSGPAIAASAWWERAALTLDGRGEVGRKEVAGIHLGALGAGLEWWLVPTLRLRTTALLLGATGRSSDQREASGGAGGELAIRLVPFPRWFARPYVRMSAGFLLFLRSPFLPGGDFYDFILGLGAGLEAPIGARTTLFADAHAAHLSNGQGLGPFNPSFDGYGGILGVNVALADTPSDPATESAPDHPEAVDSDEAPSRGVPGVLAGLGAGNSPEVVYAGRVRVTERLSARTLVVVDAQVQSIGGLAYEDVGVGFVVHGWRATVAAQATYQRLSAIHAWMEQVQVEAHVSPETSIVGAAFWQQNGAFADTITGGLGLRFLPIASVRIDGGARVTHTVGTNSDTTVGPFIGLEWQLPLRTESWMLSIFAEEQISTIRMAGLRFYWNAGGTLRAEARRTGWAHLR
ncbi:MAG TPA: hypothetical protein VIU64_23270 [Polyangia bacterium]